jgi:hypothetical protein
MPRPLLDAKQLHEAVVITFQFSPKTESTNSATICADSKAIACSNALADAMPAATQPKNQNIRKNGLC